MNQENKINLKIGIVGCGNIAKVHLRFVTQYVAKSDIALCDLDPLRLEEFAKTVGIEHTYIDLDAMLSSFKPEIVHILTPPFTHKTIAEKCLKKGCHVLIEKPICVSLEEVNQISQAAQENKKLVCVDHMRLFDPLVLKAVNMVKSGQIGEIVNISAAYSYDYLQRVDSDPASKWIKDLPGGPFFDVIPHPLCVIDKLLPGLKLEKSVTIKNIQDLDTELWCVFTSLNKTATLHMSLNINPLVNYLEIECTQGIIKVDLRNFLLTVRKKGSLPNAIERIAGNFSVGTQIIRGTVGSIFKFIGGKLDPYSGLNKIIEKFYTAVRKNGSSPVPLEEAKKLLELTLAIFSYQKFGKEKNVQHFTELAPADFLVTGGTGFIGRRLVNKLIENGHTVRIFSHRSLNENEIGKMFAGKVDVVKGNIYNLDDVKKACLNVKKIIHLAAAMKGDWNYHLDTTITGTRNILEAAELSHVDQLVYVSTINVYDAKKYPRNGIINEEFSYEDMPEKRGSYSHAKLRAEKLVKEFINKSSVAITVVRPGLVYGPNRPAFLQDVGYRIGKRWVFVIGSGRRRLPLVYVDNLVDALILTTKKKDKAGKGIFNVVDDEYPTQRAYIKAYKELTKERLSVLYIPTLMISSGFWMIERLVSVMFKKKVFLNYKLRCVSRNVTHSTERIKQELSWEQKICFKEGLRRCV